MAVLADIHGNIDALDAVLQDLSRDGCIDHILVLGDLVAFGPDAIPVVERLLSMPRVSCILGNTDRWVASGESPLPPEDRRTEEHLRGSLGIARTCGWTAAQLSACGRLQWLSELPPETRLTLPGGRRLLAVHGSPASDEEGIGDHMPSARLGELVRAAHADLILAGHTHRPFHATIDGTEVYTVTSVSNPKGTDRSAAYAVVDATGDGQSVSRRSVRYDYHAVVARACLMGYPAAHTLARDFGLD
jgi:predicted phosphodiesterase